MKVAGKAGVLCLLLALLPAAVATAHTADSGGTAAHAADGGVTAALEGRYEDALSIWLEEDDASALHNIAGLYLTGVLGAADLKTARAYFERAAARDHAPSMLSLGYLAQEGLDAPPDPVAAEAWFARAAGLGLAEAKVAWARAVMGRHAEAAELQAALEALKAAAAEGDAQALSSIGDLLRTGTFVDRDVRRALQYYERAATLGAPMSLTSVGEIHLFGELGEPDVPSAVAAYRAAAAAGDTEAMYALASLYDADPDAEAQALEEAFNFARTAAEAWHDRAQLLVGRMYLNGRGTARSSRQAYFWLILASSAGVAEARPMLALAHADIGAEQARATHADAMRWFEENHDIPHTHSVLGGTPHRFR